VQLGCERHERGDLADGGRWAPRWAASTCGSDGVSWKSMRHA
jgi:hypothetical protein